VRNPLLQRLCSDMRGRMLSIHTNKTSGWIIWWEPIVLVAPIAND